MSQKKSWGSGQPSLAKQVPPIPASVPASVVGFGLDEQAAVRASVIIASK